MNKGVSKTMKNLEWAKKNFASVCEALDNRKWNYDANEKDLTIECKVNGDDLVIDIEVQIDADRDIAILLSRMPYTVSDEKKGDLVRAVNFMNCCLAEGSVDYNYKKGFLCYRLANSYRESVMDPSVYDRMIMMSCNTVDDINEKLLLLSLGSLSLEEFKKQYQD